MTTRQTLLRRAARLTAAALATASGIYLSGCGGSSSMASSSFGWRLASLQGYGNPTVEIQPGDGAGTTGSFEIESSTSVLQAGVPIFLEAIYFAEIPNVNPGVFPGPEAPVGTFTAVWSEVPASAGGAPLVTFNNAVGNTFSGYTPSAGNNVRVNGVSGTFITVSQPSTVKIKLSVTLQTSDGSTRDKDFFVDVTVGPAPTP